MGVFQPSTVPVSADHAGASPMSSPHSRLPTTRTGKLYTFLWAKGKLLIHSIFLVHAGYFYLVYSHCSTIGH